MPPTSAPRSRTPQRRVRPLGQRLFDLGLLGLGLLGLSSAAAIAAEASIPPLDARAPTDVRTATFALG